MELGVVETALLAATGLAAGWLNVMAGGGSLLTVPMMVFLGLPGPVANGTNRVAIVAQNAVATATFFRRGFADLGLSLSLAAAAVPGAVLGAAVGTQLSGEWFDRVLAVVMIAVMIVMLLPRADRGDTPAAAEVSRSRLVAAHVLMFGAGIWGGFIQIGVGFLLMPILYRVLRLDLVRVNMHKVVIVLVYTLFALLVYAREQQVVWLAGAALALGNAAGGYLGARTAIGRGEPWIRGVLLVVLSGFVVKLLFF
ncbi:MAG: sulfite exporter TauE/SafE family protein [Pseudomonadota bacterium]